MDKMNYIAELQNHLKQKVNKSTLQKMIEYYEQYFEDHIEEGIDEEKISNDLGTPEMLANSLLAGMELKATEIFKSEESVRLIDVSLFDVRVHLVLSDQKETSITYQSQEVYDEQMMEMVYRSNHLRLLQTKPNLTKTKPYLLIELPKTYKGKLMIKTIDSRIVVDGNHFDTKINFVLSSKHGKIELNDVHCKKIDAKTGDGRLKMTRVNSNQMTLENNHGNMMVTKSQMAYLEAKSQTGRIDVSHCYSEYIELESVEGKVYVEDCMIDECHLQSEHGRIFYGMAETNEGLHLDLLSRQGKVVINGQKQQKSVQIIKDVRAKKKEKRYFNVYARTSTGKIEILH